VCWRTNCSGWRLDVRLENSGFGRREMWRIVWGCLPTLGEQEDTIWLRLAVPVSGPVQTETSHIGGGGVRCGEVNFICGGEAGNLRLLSYRTQRWRKSGAENYIMRSLIFCSLHQSWLVWLNDRQWDWRDVKHATRKHTNLLEVMYEEKTFPNPLFFPPKFGRGTRWRSG
jgi:hypothetical protein